MLVLGLDSATNVASLALVNDQGLLADVNFNTKKTHSQKLMPMLDWVLKQNDLTIDMIDAFSVAVGPGSFTGLRIGLATIKALAHVKNKPVIAIPTLDGLANNYAGMRGYICPILNARKNEVYTALYKSNGKNVEKLSEYQALGITALIENLKDIKDSITFVGDGVPIYGEELLKNLETCILGKNTNILCRASQIAQLGYEKLVDGKIDDYYQLEPFYIRASEAEINWKKRNALV